jgi:elongation factor G
MDLEAACAAVEPIYGEAAKAGLQEIVRSGVGDGNPLTDMKIKVVALAPAEGGTSELAFQTAARKALSEAVETGGPLVLEPIMKLEVTSPQAQIGNVIADLTSRRGRVTEVDSQDMGIARVVALVPLGELFGYASSLRSLSGGRGDFVAEPSVYAPL